jgi:peptidoglycan hydrolase-like protein with peptidoglycan-binding domain
MRSVTLAMLTTVALFLPAVAQQNDGSPQPQGHINAQNQNADPAMSGTMLSENLVRLLQQNLSNRGFLVGAPDGKWGPKTKEALEEFQKSQNLPASGQIDQPTLARLGVNIAPATGGPQTTGQGPNEKAPNQNSGPSQTAPRMYAPGSTPPGNQPRE